MIDTTHVAQMILRNSQYAIQEVEQQPQKWRETFAIVRGKREELKAFLTPGYDVIFTGAGTSEYIGGTITRELNLRGDRSFTTVGSPDIVTHPQFYYRKNRKTILVSFARGGDSPESMGAIQHADALIDDVKHLFITCNPNGKMMEYARAHPERVMVLMMPEGTFDQSYAMTSSFTCMALAGYLCFSLDRLDELEEYVMSAAALGDKVLEEESGRLWELVHAAPFEKFNALGSGNLKSLAQEAEIKVLEVSAGRPGTWHDSIPGFRHGPTVTVRSGVDTLTVIFYENSDYVNQYADDMLMEIRHMGRSFNKILAITPRHTKAADEYADMEVFLDDQKLPSVFLALPMILVVHLITLYRGWEYGIGSDYPFGRAGTSGIGTIVYPI